MGDDLMPSPKGREIKGFCSVCGQVLYYLRELVEHSTGKHGMEEGRRKEEEREAREMRKKFEAFIVADPLSNTGPPRWPMSLMRYAGDSSVLVSVCDEDGTTIEFRCQYFDLYKALMLIDVQNGV